jgi:acetylornithine/N-succinyldiaminopimelate aminotransferase
LTESPRMRTYSEICEREVRDLEEKYLFPTYKRYDVALSHGSGAYLYDFEGRRYLDFLAGIAVNSLGYDHPRISRVLREQGRDLIHSSNLFYHRFQGLLAKRLVEISGLSRVFFTNSGAEAIEAALKIVRAHARRQGHGDKTEVLSLQGAFHGRTFGSLSLTMQEKYQAPFRPLVPGVRMIESATRASLEQAISGKTCALFLETVQGESGVIPLAAEFLESARELCTRHEALLVLDEIQCGLGRTGRYFAFQHFGVEPDLITIAKPLAAGYPLGAVIGSARTADSLQAGEHGTTFGGGPLACRMALEYLDVLEEDGLLENAVHMGQYLVEQLRRLMPRHGLIREIRGLGLMIGVEVGPAAALIVKKMLARGVIANAAHDTVVRLLPPLIINRNHVDEFLRVFDEALREMEAESVGGDPR